MVLFLKNLMFTILAPGTIGFLAPILIGSGKGTVEEIGIIQLIAMPILGIGISIYLWCLWDFATFGKGTPAPIDAPRKLVVRGLYRYIRNPMYVGVLIIILGWAVFYKELWILLYGIIIFLLFNSFVLLYEEKKLLKLFGQEFAVYKRQVGRWIPRRKK